MTEMAKNMEKSVLCSALMECPFWGISGALKSSHLCRPENLDHWLLLLLLRCGLKIMSQFPLGGEFEKNMEQWIWSVLMSWLDIGQVFLKVLNSRNAESLQFSEG